MANTTDTNKKLDAKSIANIRATIDRLQKTSLPGAIYGSVKGLFMIAFAAIGLFEIIGITERGYAQENYLINKVNDLNND